MSMMANSGSLRSHPAEGCACLSYSDRYDYPAMACSGGFVNETGADQLPSTLRPLQT
jgi:hypothetical protein